MNPLLNVVDFLVQVSVTLYIYAIVIRVLLGITSADFYNPFSQFILTITGPVLRPLRRWIPNAGRIDIAALALIILLKLGELLIRGLLVGGKVTLGALLIATFFELANLVINLFIFAIVVLALTSWLSPNLQMHPLVSVLHTITAPLLKPAKRYIPPVGAFDLSPLAVIIVLYCVKIFLSSMYL